MFPCLNQHSKSWVLVHCNNRLVFQDSFIIWFKGPQIHRHEQRSRENGPHGHLCLALLIGQTKVSNDQLQTRDITILHNNCPHIPCLGHSSARALHSQWWCPGCPRSSRLFSQLSSTSPENHNKILWRRKTCYLMLFQKMYLDICLSGSSTSLG